MMTLDELDCSLVGGDDRGSSELAFVRAASRALQAMAGPARAFATIVCEPRDAGGLRVVEGHDAVMVARRMRAQAEWRGDTAWATLMGQRLLFHVVTRPARRRG